MPTSYRVCSILIWLALTGFISAAYALQIPKGYNQELLVLGILYVYITCYIIFCHVPTTIITTPWKRGIHATSGLIHQHSTYIFRTALYGLIVLGVIAATVFSFPEKEESPRLRRLISLFGLFVFVFGTFAASVVGSAYVWALSDVAHHQGYISIASMCSGIQSSQLFWCNFCWHCLCFDLQ